MWLHIYYIFTWRLFYWRWESSCSSPLGIVYFLQLIQLRAADCWRDAAFFHPDFVARKWAMPWAKQGLVKSTMPFRNQIPTWQVSTWKIFKKQSAFSGSLDTITGSLLRNTGLFFCNYLMFNQSFSDFPASWKSHHFPPTPFRGWASPRRHTVAAPGANRLTRDLDESLWFRTGLKMRLPVAWDMISENRQNVDIKELFF